jgi:dihydrofolate synthase/folylpolyglutamate synthase
MPPLEHIVERLKNLHPKAIDLSLDRLERLLRRLGSPERRLPPVIHVAGTNGKGSLVAFMRAIFEADGRRVHVYTSPHLVRFNERTRLAGRLIEDDLLQDVLLECEAVNAGDAITQFEITTAASFLAFARVPADVLLLETGLGGRLDATNVVERPALTAITPISFDHMERLGDTIAKIAGEKAGILKKGVPVVVGPQTDEALGVIERRARDLDARIVLWERDYRVRPATDGFNFASNAGERALPRPGLAGQHQIANAATAVACVETQTICRIASDAVAAGLLRVEWPARLQRLARGALADALAPDCELWLDGCHNQGGAEAIAETLASWRKADARPIHLIVGMKETKDATTYFRPFAGIVASVAAIPIPDETHYPPEGLAAVARGLGIEARAAASAREALARLPAGTRVLICGSLYLAGRILADNG